MPHREEPANALMPEPIMVADAIASQIEALHHNLDGYDYADMFPHSEWLLGYRIPDFQRPVVWNEARRIRFVESAWLGLGLGTYCVNEIDGRGAKAHPMDRLLIDGRQRLFALDAYFRDAFPVLGYRWSEITQLDRRRFRGRNFARIRIRLDDETTLRDLYDRLNFGGVPHEESQRAVKANRKENDQS
jgi:hypothetical protein